MEAAYCLSAVVWMELVSADFKAIVQQIVSGLKDEKDPKRTLGTVRAA